MSRASYVKDLVAREGFFDLTGNDGCLCAHITLQSISIDVHCWKTRGGQWVDKKWASCDCPRAGVHIRGGVYDDPDELVALGEVIRDQIQRPDMEIPVVIHEGYDADQYCGYVKPDTDILRQTVNALVDDDD